MTTSQRPYIICHMMQTIDGKIASGIPDQEILMDYFDIYTETEKKLDAKVWMFGRITGQAFAESVDTTLPISKGRVNDEDFITNANNNTFVVITDSKGRLRWKENYISLSDQPNKFQLIIIVSSSTPKEYLAYLQAKQIAYIYGGKNEVDTTSMLNKLKSEFNIKKILLEGGGSFNGSLLKTDAVDEISLLLLPRVLNKKDAPSIFDQDTANATPKDFKLFSLEHLERGVLWLRYKKNL